MCFFSGITGNYLKKLLAEVVKIDKKEFLSPVQMHVRRSEALIREVRQAVHTADILIIRDTVDTVDDSSAHDQLETECKYN